MPVMVLDAAGQWIDVATLPEVARLIEAADEVIAAAAMPTAPVVIELDAAAHELRA
jgi:hypothetical protein